MDFPWGGSQLSGVSTRIAFAGAELVEIVVGRRVFKAR